MRSIVIVGNSYGAGWCASLIRKVDKESHITLVTFNEQLPYDRSRFTEYIAQFVTENDLLLNPEDFYPKNNINVVSGKKITRINIRRKRVYLEGNTQIAFDYLIACAPHQHKLPKLRGFNKNGVYSLRTLADAKEIVKNLLYTEAIAVEDNSLSGIELAALFRKGEKEVMLVTPGPYVLSEYINPYAGAMLSDVLEAGGIRIITNETITEALGESDIKAVRMQSGKVFAAQMLVRGDSSADCAIYSDIGLSQSNTLDVNDRFKTGADGVYAIEDIASFLDDRTVVPVTMTKDFVQYQAEVVAGAITNNQQEVSPPVIENTIALDGCEITVLGRIAPQTGTKKYYFSDPESDAYCTLFVNDNTVAAAVLVNCADKKDALRGYIQDKEDCSELIASTAPQAPSGASQQDIQQVGVVANEMVEEKIEA